MSDKNLEIMKKLIEEKKNKGKTTVGGLKPQKSLGNSSKSSRGNKKTGGLFDKG